jgi:exopolysaccharide biosynthesis polyprenyl glycosylphosphotransferase
MSNNIDAVILVGSEFLAKSRFNAIAWALEGIPVDLIVAPGLLDASSPRVHYRQVSGVSFLEVESPKFEGAQYLVKTAFDFVFSLIALAITLPITFVVALLIVLEDRGPVFFRQVRIGVNGKPFKMWKFRSMYVGAEKKFDELRAQAGYETNSVQFKLKDDPRITRVGKLIRKLSIDELPQFINVLSGHMSVVGPRPHVQAEIDMYEDHVHRRLLVKPGITGPWQVGGRSLLTWEESVDLDLGYVENWSLAGDIIIIAKTLDAIRGSKSAF